MTAGAFGPSSPAGHGAAVRFDPLVEEATAGWADPEATGSAGEGEPAPAGATGHPSTTGEPRVDDALARLQDVIDVPLDEQLPIYQDVHRRLHETLADLDAR